MTGLHLGERELVTQGVLQVTFWLLLGPRECQSLDGDVLRLAIQEPDCARKTIEIELLLEGAVNISRRAVALMDGGSGFVKQVSKIG